MAAISTTRRSGYFRIVFAVCPAFHGCSYSRRRTSSLRLKFNKVPEVDSGWRTRPLFISLSFEFVMRLLFAGSMPEYEDVFYERCVMRFSDESPPKELFTLRISGFGCGEHECWFAYEYPAYFELLPMLTLSNIKRATVIVALFIRKFPKITRRFRAS